MRMATGLLRCWRPLQISFAAKVTECAVQLAVQFGRNFRMRLSVFDEGAQCSTDRCPEGDSKWRARDHIGAVIEKETNDLGLPAEQDISEGNGFDIRTVSKQQLHKIKPTHRNCGG